MDTSIKVRTVKSVITLALKYWNRFAEKCRRSGILYLHNLAGNPEEKGLLMRSHLRTFKETFPRGCRAPSRVCVVPTIDEGLKPNCNLVRQHLPKLQAAVNSLNEWQASMFPQIFRDEPEIACDAIRNLLAYIAWVLSLLSFVFSVPNAHYPPFRHIFGWAGSYTLL